MKNIALIFVVLILVSVGFLSYFYYAAKERSLYLEDVGKQGVGVVNPASAYCVENEGVVDIRVNENGGQYGVCVFPSTSECEEWAFLRGECREYDFFPHRRNVIIKMSNGRIDLLGGDIVESFRYDGDLSDFEIGDEVEVDVTDAPYGEAEVLKIEEAE